MKVKVFQPNAHGKIEFTRTELEKLLNEIYNEGRKDERNQNCYPFIYNTPYYRDSITGTATISGACLNSTKATDSIDKLTCNSTTVADSSNATPTFTVSLGGNDAINQINQDKIVQHVQEIVNNFKKTPDDPFSKLAKELNF